MSVATTSSSQIHNPDTSYELGDQIHSMDTLEKVIPYAWLKHIIAYFPRVQFLYCRNTGFATLIKPNLAKSSS